MKKLFLICFMLLFSMGTCFAHWMPTSETYVGGVGYGCTMGYVKSIYGEPAQKEWFNSDGMRGVWYIYSPTFRVVGRAGNVDTRSENDLTVVGYDSKANNLSTPSGITVGISYDTVAGMYGREPLSRSYDGKMQHIYKFGDMQEMIFYVDDTNIITEIRFGTSA